MSFGRLLEKYPRKFLRYKTVRSTIFTAFPLSVYVCSAGLGEFRIRDLNDEINKLLREKRHWEERIIELGGTDYIVSGR